MNLNQTERPTQEEIAACAYQIYLEEGSVPGREIDHWLRAEAKLIRERRLAKEEASVRNIAPPIAQDWRTGDGENRKANQPRSRRRETSQAPRVAE